jgi:hypothetical protein
MILFARMLQGARRGCICTEAFIRHAGFQEKTGPEKTVSHFRRNSEVQATFDIFDFGQRDEWRKDQEPVTQKLFVQVYTGAVSYRCKIIEYLPNILIPQWKFRYRTLD